MNSMIERNEQPEEAGGCDGDLNYDLRDGRNPIFLLSFLLNEQNLRKPIPLGMHMLQNVRTVLDFVTRHGIETATSICAEDIANGDPMATRSLTEAVLLHFPELLTKQVGTATGMACPWSIIKSINDCKSSGEDPVPWGRMLTLQVDRHGCYRWIYDVSKLTFDLYHQMDQDLRKLVKKSSATTSNRVLTRKFDAMSDQALMLIFRELISSNEFDIEHHANQISVHNSLLYRMECTINDKTSTDVPPNVILEERTVLTPEMLPLIDLTQADIDYIVTQVPGGIPNIQDIYALSPLQDGILFHHLLHTKSDPYLRNFQIAFRNRISLNCYISAVQRIVDRDDLMRTSFFWEKLSTPAQVVCRKVMVPVTELGISSVVCSARDELVQGFNPRWYRLNLHEAPLLHLVIAREDDGTWILNQLFHRLVCDSTGFQALLTKIDALATENPQTLDDPIPFRNWIAYTRSGAGKEAHQQFFTDMLVDVDQSTLSFGISCVYRNDAQISATHWDISNELDDQLRRHAKDMNVSVATFCHVTWALVVSRTSGLETLVFGTVLFTALGVSQRFERISSFFHNILPLRFDIDDLPVRSFIRNTHIRLFQILLHEHSTLSMAHRCSSAHLGTPLFNTLLSYQHGLSSNKDLDIDIGGELVGCTEVISYPIEMSICDDGTDLSMLCKATEPANSGRICAYMQRALESLVECLESERQMSVRQIDILPESERSLICGKWIPKTEMPQDFSCIHQYFEKQAAMRPTEIALSFQDKLLTYGDLNTRANRLAHRLIEFGVRPEFLVGVCVSISMEMLIGILAILKAGGAYVPLDSGHPRQRLMEIITDASLKIVIADGIGLTKIDGHSPLPCIVVNPNAPLTYPGTNPIVHELGLRNLTYVMFTSGSTGKPKGVLVEHGNIVNLLNGMDFHVHLTHTDVWGLFHSISFDFSVHEIWGALRYGAKLVLVSREELCSPDDMYALICENNITVLSLTPGSFKTIIDHLVKESIPSRLHYVLLGGEALDPSMLQPLYSAYGEALPQFINMYGPTEITVTATVKHLQSEDALTSASLIGKGLPHTRIYLLGNDRKPVPLGAVGEIYIGGAGVSRGYFSRPELTNERFVDDPFSHVAGARMYKTSDLARFSPNGDLIYMGRSDQQLKVRGFRIEAGEIEACLRRHSSVRDALVLIRGDEQNERLVAYVIAETRDNLVATLRSHVMTELPEYMVPSSIVKLDAFPLNCNGKVDTRALPVPNDSALARQAYEAPQGDIETVLATIWEEVLNIKNVGRNDSFFAIGGHSLLAFEIIQRVLSAGLELTMRNLFEHPTLSELAESITADCSVEIPPNTIMLGIRQITPEMLPLIDLTQADIDHIVTQIPNGIENIQDIYSLSPMQDGILIHHLMTTKSDPYVVIFQSEFRDRFILDRYIMAMEKVLIRHDILRTAFFWENLSTPAQVVLREVKIPVTEAEVSPDQGSGCKLLTRYDRNSYRMNLQKAPLIHFVIGREPDGRWSLEHLQHHLISDGVLLEIMLSEAAVLMSGQELTLQDPTPFRNLIASIRAGISQEGHAVFFTEMLADVSESTLAFGLAEVHRDGSSIVQSQQYVTPQLNDQVRQLARHMKVSVGVFSHLSWALLVSRASGLEKVVFGTVLFEQIARSKGTGTAIGLSINTLPIKFVIDDSPVRDSIYHTHNGLARLLEHEHASLAIAQRCSGVTSGTPLFNSLLNCRHNTIMETSNSIPDGMKRLNKIERTNYPLMLAVDDNASNFTFMAQTVLPVKPDHVCALMDECLTSLCKSLISGTDVPLAYVNVISEPERTLLLETWNIVGVMQPDVLCLHQHFERQAALAPAAIALIHDDGILTYAELNVRANRLAYRLIELGVGPDRLIGICTNVSHAMMVGILAILKAGAAYVPLDPNYPLTRLMNIITDASLNIIVADEIGHNILTIDTVTLVHPHTPRAYAEVNPSVLQLGPRSLAYIIYTSGSTGRPKGVMIEHQAVHRLLDATVSQFNFTACDVWCLFHSMAFDVSVWEIWGALRYGGQLVLMSRDVVHSPEATYKLLDDHSITVLNITPSSFEANMDNFLKIPTLHHLRYIIFAGESLNPSILQELIASQKNSLPVYVNMYGTTETTIHSTFKSLDNQDASLSSSLIGRPNSNARIYLLGANKQPVPIGAVGEICIGGFSLARGYLHRSELTGERFLPDPFCNAFEGRMYRTGDLARYSSDGSLIFMGRNDQQVKVRGFRIETGEVENCLKCHPEVNNALVMTYGGESNKRLVAYVKAHAREDLLTTLHAHVSSKLPVYMIPSAIVRLDAFPLTPNGKIDLRALPKPDETALVRQRFEAPKGKVEKMIATIWEDLLGVQAVSRNDSFFALGGHSLIIMKLIERFRRLGYEFSMTNLFMFPTLSELAKTFTAVRSIAIPPNVIRPEVRELTPEMLPLIELTQLDIDHIISIVPGGIENIQDIYSLSPMQDGILFHHLMTPENDPYVLMIQLQFRDRLILDQYISALEKVVARHDILRTAFLWEMISTPAQVVYRRVKLSVTEVKISPNEGSACDQLTRHHSPLSYRIDLRRAPLIRLMIARESDGSWVLVHLQHHLITDHTMIEIMHAETMGILREQKQELSKPIPFRNLIASVRACSNENAIVEFFTEMLADIDQPSLAFDVLEVYRDGSMIAESFRSLPCDLNDRVRSVAESMDVSVAVLCHLCWAIILSRASRLQKLVFGTVLFERISSDTTTDNAIGLFINTLPVKFVIDNSPIQDHVFETRNSLARLLEHQHASLAVAQRCSGLASGTPLFNSILNYRHDSGKGKFNDMGIGIKLLGTLERTNYPIMLSVDDYGTALGLTAEIVEPIDPDYVCAYMEQTLTSLTECLVLNSKIPICCIGVLPKPEYELLFETWNVDEVTQPEVLCLHEYFERQVNHAPTAPALIYEDEICTYEELNIRANQLAYQLIELGVGPNDLIGTCVTVSWAMIITILAISKAGGAYVALDPEYPRNRLRNIITEASLSIIIADKIGVDKLTDEMPAPWTFVDPNALLVHPRMNPQLSTLKPQNLAYILYTSGSTGRPKGVMIEHQHVIKYFDGLECHVDITKTDVWCLLHSVAFDMSVQEVWGALRYGGSLVLVSREQTRSPDLVYELIRQRGITILIQTPGAFKATIHKYVDESLPDELRFIVFCGETLDPTVLQPLYSANRQTLPQLINMYGPTETTALATLKYLDKKDTLQSASPIGKGLPHTKIYLLNDDRQPVPLGAVGEIYIGGTTVARGYLNRPDLNRDCFIEDPFSQMMNARMYKTADLAKYLPDGNLIFLGRNDRQLKIRGFRIEAGEVESCLRCHYAVRDSLVLAHGEEPNKRLIAYVVAEPLDEMIPKLRAHVMDRLPEYMVPSAVVRIDAFPLTSNGKVDLKALPLPEESALDRRAYVAPKSEIEIMLAEIWKDVLNVESVSRNDSFFAIGGHSLVAFKVNERVRNLGYRLTVRHLFEHSTLADIAKTIETERTVMIPANAIVPGAHHLTPDMLPLIELTQADIDYIITQVPGGIDNIQDIYALSPLQDGILFHHLMTVQGDPYIMVFQSEFRDRYTLDHYISAVEKVLVRHDVLRTAFFWDTLSQSAQVVLREVMLSVSEHKISPNEGSACEQLISYYDPRSYRMNLQTAPLIRFAFGRQSDGSWILIHLQHHLISDHTMLKLMHAESLAFMQGHEKTLSKPMPFRHLIANVRADVSKEEHALFFSDMLADVSQPTLAYGLTEVYSNNLTIAEAQHAVPSWLVDQVRNLARTINVSVAVICHLSWALVVARTSGLKKIIFGTVLFERLGYTGDQEHSTGLFINTLPIKFVIEETPVHHFIRQTQTSLARLLEHEHSSLALAQRCSGLKSGTPLFNSLLNCRHQSVTAEQNNAGTGIKILGNVLRTNYPLTFSVDDDGSSLALIAQTAEPVSADQVCDLMQQTLESIFEASNTNIPVDRIEVLPQSQRKLLLETWNINEGMQPDLPCLHQHFERQVLLRPKAVALIRNNTVCTYQELNTRANRLAHHLIELGVRPEQLVGICVSVSEAIVIGILAILKAGGAYVPLDQDYPQRRLTDIINGISLGIVIVDENGFDKLNTRTHSSFVIIDSDTSHLFSETNPSVRDLQPQNLAYILHTSGSTGKPKAVMVEHGHAVRLFDAMENQVHITGSDVCCLFHSVAFDVSVYEIFGSLRYGAKLVLLTRDEARSPHLMYRAIHEHGITVLNQTPSAFKAIMGRFLNETLRNKLRYVILGGESLDSSSLLPWYSTNDQAVPEVVNIYGPTETTIVATAKTFENKDTFDAASRIGKTLQNTKIYLLDDNQRPVPLGVVGEIYIGGTSVARGYLGMPDQTKKCFLHDPYSQTLGARMYKTADLAKYLPDGNLVYLGRIDRQLKVRGFRIEAGEIESCLRCHHAVHDALVVAHGEEPNKRLVAYVVAEVCDNLIAQLRSHVKSELPEYMVPAIITPVASFPLNHNGKVDLQALPLPDELTLNRAYEAPKGEIEIMLATVWKEVLNIKTVSRNDSFFAIGGHSLNAFKVNERVRNLGYELAIRNFFEHSTLSELAKTIEAGRSVEIPPNVILPGVRQLTPEMLPLVEMTQTEINHVIGEVSGGIDNIEDIYSLSPLQDGILFHHLIAPEHDPHMIFSHMRFRDRHVLNQFIAAIEQVLVRHDILRTAFFWKKLSKPVQVVHRRVRLPVTEFEIMSNGGSACDQLTRRYEQSSYRLNLQKAPLIQFFIGRESDGSWIVLHLQHHLICDHTMLRIMQSEAVAFMQGRGQTVTACPPFRHLIANVRAGMSQKEHTIFFSNMLGDVTQPTLAFGLAEVHCNGSMHAESDMTICAEINDRLRYLARNMNVSVAVFCHLSWAILVSRVSGLDIVVFGTVLFERIGFSDERNSDPGLFINTLPMKFIMDDTSVHDCISQTQNSLARLLEHEHASLVLAQRCSGLRSGTPLFNSLLNCRHHVEFEKLDENESGITILNCMIRTNYPLTLSVDDGDSSLTLVAQTVEPVKPDYVCTLMQQTLTSISESLIANARSSIRCIEVIPKCERELLLQINDTNEVMPPDVLCLHQYFENRFALTPTATAMTWHNQGCTYQELNTRANRLAHQLIELGVGPDHLVGICVSVSQEMIIAILAILKAGGGYVPLDPEYPEKRLNDVISESSLRIVIVDKIGSTKLRIRTSFDLVMIFPEAPMKYLAKNPNVQGLTSKNLAYVIFTSGTTGKPKGVMVEHRHVSRFLDAMMDQMPVTHNDVWVLSHSISFDFSVIEMWGALRYGGQLVIVSREDVCSPDCMYELTCTHGITVLSQTPSTFKTISSRLIEKSLPDQLRYVILAGEALCPSILRPLFVAYKKTLPRFINMYGPTETTIGVTVDHVSEEITLQSGYRIGRSLSHTKIYLLGNDRRPVPLGAVGEIYLSGASVTRGYLNMPELTSERFFDDPFSKTADARMFRTSDLAKYLPDGSILYMGRNDQQLKIRGFRIEAGEIETSLRRHHAVHDAVALACGNEPNKQLVAYVVAEPYDDLARILRSHVSCELPEYMIPSIIVRLDIFPLNPNGKLDLRALPAIDESTLIRETYEAPQGEVETMLAEIWQDVLNVKHVSRNDSFFDLGGHSLIAFQVNERVRSFGYEFTVRNLFQHAILSDLAKTIEANRSIPIPANVIVPGVDRLTPDMLPLIELTQGDINKIVSEVPGGIDNIQDIYALSPLQDGILFHHLITTASDPYVVVFQMKFRDRHILDRFIEVFEMILTRYDILRTAFFWETLSTPAQVVLRKVTLPVTELEILPDEGSAYEQLNRRYDPRSYRMNLQKAPLIHFAIAREFDGSWSVIHIQHHLVSDHAMLEMMHHEIKATLREKGEPLSNPLPFRNLIATVRVSSSQDAHDQFFREMLVDVSHSTLAFELTEIYSNGSSVIESHRSLPCELNDQIRQLARNINVSLAVFCHLSWALVVSRASRLEKVVFGTVLFERITSNNERNGASGSFINTLPIKFIIDDTPISKFIHQAHNNLVRLLEHEHASLVVAQRCSSLSNGTPLFNSLLNCRHNSNTEKLDDTDIGITILGGVERTNYPLMTSVDDDNSCLALTVQTADPVQPDHVCALMQETLISVCTCLISDLNTPIRFVEVIPESERKLLLETLNSVEVSQPDMLCLHQYFEKQVELTPESIALIHDAEVCTYQELNNRANRLANQLVELGVGPEQLVGVCVTVSPAMVVAIIAIQKAGGAYIPLDPEYPQQRLIDIVMDASPGIIIADEIGLDKLNFETLPSWTAVRPDAPFSYSEMNPNVHDLGLQNLAHVIYTSGSSGRPKSVMAEHRNVVRLFDATQSWSQFDQHDVWALVHSLTFDPSVWEIWGALRYGGQLVLMSRDVVRSPAATYDLMCRHNITVFNQTPTAFREILDTLIKKSFPQHLRCVILGGESFDPSVLQPLYTAHFDTLPRFINIYGPTETTMWTTFKELHKEDVLQSCSPIGYRISDTKLYLLDAHQRPVPFGAVGELYIGGPGVARGYLNRPELTSSCFLADPFSDTIDSRMYKTGDLARYRADKSVMYIGRNDDQIKIRGFRVEPREIAACLTTHPSVQHAVVVPFGESNDKILVAYVVADVENDLAYNLREYVSSKLPQYMIPSRIIRLDSLPFTSHGKLDRKALPPPDNDAFARRVYEEPKSNAECLLANIWSHLLGIETISRNDNFFTLGGHSLLALRVIGLTGDQGIQCTLNDVFQYPVLSDLASKITNEIRSQPKLATISIRPAGSESPIFFTPTANGDFSHVFSISKHIRPSCPVYALPWPNLSDGEIRTIIDVARKLVTLIKVVQNEGPYRLCGYSAGGYLCHAIADVLLDSGESVSFLGFIDTLVFNDVTRRFPWKRQITLGFLLEYADCERANDITQLLKKVDSMSLVEFIEVAKIMKLLPSKLSPDAYARQLEQCILYGQLLENYSPRELGLVIHQYKATERSKSYEEFDAEIAAFVDQWTSDWSKILPRTLFRETLISGDHLSMMAEHENRLVLAQALNQTIPIQ